MNEIPDNAIDVIVTSPPYNRKKVYSSDSAVPAVYNDNQDEELYFQFLERVWKECFRVLKPEGLFFLNIGDAARDQGKSEQVVERAVKSGFTRLQTVIWVKSFLGKGHYTPSGGKKRLNNIWENVFILVKDKNRYNIVPEAVGIPYADKSNIGRYSDVDLRDAGNVWLVPYSKTTGATIKKGHDAPFPVELSYKCIKLAGSSVTSVLDPFGGTCSTLAATRLLGKKGYAYEKYPRRDAIKERILNSDFVEKPAILIPHLELAITVLASLLQKVPLNSLDVGFKYTKKEKLEMDITREVLEKLSLEVPLLEEYSKLFQHIRKEFDERVAERSLSSFFDVKKK
ncbi:MAG: DNA-methyltransferase [Candidatus Odinarchaeota archaeon]